MPGGFLFYLCYCCVSNEFRKDFIRIRYQSQAKQAELSRKEQGPRGLFLVLLTVLKWGQEDKDWGMGGQAVMITKTNQLPSWNKTHSLEIFSLVL